MIWGLHDTHSREGIRRTGDETTRRTHAEDDRRKGALIYGKHGQAAMTRADAQGEG